MDNSDAPTNPPNQLRIPLTKAIKATTAIKLPAILATRKTAVIAPEREIIQSDETTKILFKDSLQWMHLELVTSKVQ